MTVYFIAAHFGIRNTRDAACIMLPRIFAAYGCLSIQSDVLREWILQVNSFCFDDANLANSLVCPLIFRNECETEVVV